MYMSLLMYPFIVLGFFVVAKYFKYNFTYKSIALLSILTGTVSYIAFTIIPIITIVKYFYGYLIGELIGFNIGVLFWTLIVYWLGKNIYIKLKPKKLESTA